MSPVFQTMQSAPFHSSKQVASPPLVAHEKHTHSSSFPRARLWHGCISSRKKIPSSIWPAPLLPSQCRACFFAHNSPSATCSGLIPQFFPSVQSLSSIRCQQNGGVFSTGMHTSIKENAVCILRKEGIIS